MKSIRLSPEFLSDLRAVAPAAPPQAGPDEFLRDLASVYESLCVAEVADAVTNGELHRLADHLNDWRARTQDELRKRLQHLPEDDPLHCPVSLFATMDYGRLETAHTRALAWLLDPRKEHGFGSALMDSLLERVSGHRRPTDVRRVDGELPIGDGRLDLFAEGDWIEPDGKRTPWALLLEAKIDAAEGEDQLSRYERWLEARDGCEPFKVFLAPQGRHAETNTGDWFPMPFEELAECFRGPYQRLSDRPGFHFLRYYLAGVLKDVCRWPVPIRAECADPYSVLNYLKAANSR